MAFNRDRNQGRGGGFGGRGGYNDRRGERPQMYPATCSNCARACEVPFKPNGSKPVLCNDCFRQNCGPDRRDDRPRFDKPRFEPRRDDRPSPAAPQYKEQFDSLHHKLDKILNILMSATEAQIPQKTKEKIKNVITETPESLPVEKKTKSPRKKSLKTPEPIA